jgi:hypothetical protein
MKIPMDALNINKYTALRRAILLIIFAKTIHSTAQVIPPDFLQRHLYGYWKVYKVFASDKNGDIYPVTKDELETCINEGICFSKDSIASSRGSCMYGERCPNPKYEVVQTATVDAFDNVDFVKLIGYTNKRTMIIKELNCDNVLFRYIKMLDSITILTGADNYIYLLKKQKEQFNFNLGYIKVNKCYLYNLPAEAAKTKAYLLKGDHVEILDNKIYWLKIKYTSPKDNKTIIRWIKSGNI